MKKFLKKSLAYLLAAASVSAMYVMPVGASTQLEKETVFEENFDKEYTWNKTMTGDSPAAIAYPESDSAIWRASTGGKTAGISMGVADPTGENEKMMKVSLPYVEGEDAKTVWIDNEPATFTDTITGVSVLEQSLYFDSDESLLADDSYFLMQVKFNGGAQEVTCIRNTGFWNGLKASKVSYSNLPRDEWFTIRFTSDFDNGKWYVDLVNQDGTVINIRTHTQAAKSPIEWVRYSYSDTVPEGKNSWYGLGEYSHYKIVEKEETWRDYVSMLKEDEFDGETLTSNMKWRSIGCADYSLNTNVEAPTGLGEKMLKLSIPYTEADKATVKSRYVDNANDPATDSITGVSVQEMSFYFSSNDSFLKDGYLMIQAKFNGGNQQVITLKADGFYNAYNNTTPSYAMIMPRDEWVKLMIVTDHEAANTKGGKGVMYVKYIAPDGTATTVRTLQQNSTEPLSYMRFTYADMIENEGENSWFGMGYYRHYKLKIPYEYTGVTTTGGKASVGKQIGVVPSFSGIAPKVEYQWAKCLTNTAYSSDLLKLTDIAGATKSTYTPTTADEGNNLFVKIYAVNENVKPGWSVEKQLLATYPEVGNALWAIDPNPFVIDFGKYEENATFIRNGAFYSPDALWRVHGEMGAANGTMTAKIVKNVGNAVKDDALEIDVNTPAGDNGFWMWEHNGFGGLVDDVISIEQKYFIPEGGAFTEGSAETIKQDNRFGYGANQEAAAAQWDAYGIYNGYITSSDFKTNLAPIPYGEWFGVKVVYFTKKSDDAVMYRDIVLVREDGTTENLVCGAVINNATMLAAVKNGGYRRSRTSVNLVDAATKPHFYFGDFIVKTDKYYSDTPALILDKEKGVVAGGTVITNYDSTGATPVMLAVALYQGGHLVGIKIADEEVKNDKAYKLTTSITEQVFEKGDVVKSFVFNKDTLEPIANCASIVVE